MKKLNRKGFTLIELLAVITIMGILMLIAIPAVQRTIENSRRDTFASTAKSYINAMKNSVASDEVYVDGQPISALDDDAYYCYSIDTTNESASDLMEQGGRSSWGNANVKGYIVIYKKLVKVTNEIDADDNTQVQQQGDQQEENNNNNNNDDDDDNAIYKTKYEYAIFLVDTGKHGIPKLTKENDIRRNAVMTNTKDVVGKDKPDGADVDSFDEYKLAAKGTADAAPDKWCEMVKVN